MAIYKDVVMRFVSMTLLLRGLGFHEEIKQHKAALFTAAKDKSNLTLICIS